MDKLRAKIGGGHQPHPKTEEEKKYSHLFIFLLDPFLTIFFHNTKRKLRDLKPRIAKSNFLARLNIFDEQLGTAKEILARWKLGIGKNTNDRKKFHKILLTFLVFLDEYGDKYEPVQVLEVVYEELSANQKSILHGIQVFIFILFFIFQFYFH